MAQTCTAKEKTCSSTYCHYSWIQYAGTAHQPPVQYVVWQSGRTVQQCSGRYGHYPGS
ncbi:MAG: hypothetical protein H6546_03655 [Chitinophagales bacterium]|nr:hypothetical protein [Chitinophagales bacterium]HAE34865.1 hypothetical protein [Bacteroidota bacterium]